VATQIDQVELYSLALKRDREKVAGGKKKKQQTRLLTKIEERRMKVAFNFRSLVVFQGGEGRNPEERPET